MERKPVKDRFKDTVTIVTGGLNGIGRATVEELCKEGGSVAICDISEAGETTTDELREQGYDVMLQQGDLEEEVFCNRSVEATVEKWGKVNYLFNNAFAFTAQALNATAADWQRSLMVGPVGYARMIQNVAPYMKKSGGGALVNNSSISGFVAQKERWTYNMSKGAVNQLTKCAALDLAPWGIRVNSVSPGWIWTREVYKAAEMDGGGREKWDPVWGAYHMLRRCGEPVEVARAVLFLLSDDASFITGTDLPVDGGYQSMGPEGLGETAVVAGSD